MFITTWNWLIYEFFSLKTFRAAMQIKIVITISGSVFPTGISILIKIRYRMNPITQITAFVMSTASPGCRRV